LQVFDFIEAEFAILMVFGFFLMTCASVVKKRLLLWLRLSRAGSFVLKFIFSFWLRVPRAGLSLVINLS